MSFSLRTMGQLFFSYKGRINRKTFILSYLYLGLTFFSFPVILGVKSFSPALAGAFLLALLLSLLLYAFFATYIKGLGLNHSGCYSFFLLSLPVGLCLISKSFSLSPKLNFLMAGLLALFIALFVCASLAIRIKRLHDIGHSAWWSVLFFLSPLGLALSVYLAAEKGSLKANRFGEPPLSNKKSSPAPLNPSPKQP